MRGLRERFEAALRARGWTDDKFKRRQAAGLQDEYVKRQTSGAWIGWQAATQPEAAPPPAIDPQLARFYQVSTVAELLTAQEEHIDKLQDSARRNVKPWEDTFPPTLLPKYLRDSGLATPPPAAAPVVDAFRPEWLMKTLADLEWLAARCAARHDLVAHVKADSTATRLRGRFNHLIDPRPKVSSAVDLDAEGIKSVKTYAGPQRPSITAPGGGS